MGLIVALAVAGTTAHATDFDFSSIFEFDNDVALVNVTLEADTAVTVFTSSWIQGEPFPGGEPPLGFDPIVAVWDALGDQVYLQDDGHREGRARSNGVWYDYGIWDAYFDLFLPAGGYSLSVTQVNNNPNGTSLSEGFRYDLATEPNFTAGWGPQDRFNGVWGGDGNDPRTGNWALHVTTTVPEPSTWLVLGVGGLVIARLRRRRH